MHATLRNATPALALRVPSNSLNGQLSPTTSLASFHLSLWPRSQSGATAVVFHTRCSPRRPSSPPFLRFSLPLSRSWSPQISSTGETGRRKRPRVETLIPRSGSHAVQAFTLFDAGRRLRQCQVPPPIPIQEMWIEEHLMERINTKGQVNLFETTIRVLAGLLSAYHLSGGEHGNLEDSGISLHLKEAKPEVFLKIAKNLADKLLAAFTSSQTSIPFSDVILHDSTAHPAPDGLSSTSEVSTLQLEFNYLSKISGDPRYGSEAMKVLEHLRTLPKVEGLVPIYISPHSGQFNGGNIRLGSRGDSYYEYLIKVWIQQKNSRNSHLNYLYEMYTEAMKGVRHLLVRRSIPKGLVFVGELPYGSNGGFSTKMDHLVCFLPGTLALGATKGITKQKAIEGNLLTAEDMENLKLAEDLAKTCFEMYSVTSTGLAPEIVYFHVEGGSEGGPDGGNKSSEYVNDIIIKPNDRHNLLRPETVESLFVLYRITEDSKYREWGWQIFEAFEKYTKVDSGGYTSLDDVTTIPPQKRDKMETFFLGETLKYLYLLFGDNNVLPLDKFVFNTEAHPFPVNLSG